MTTQPESLEEQHPPSVGLNPDGVSFTVDKMWAAHRQLNAAIKLLLGHHPASSKLAHQISPKITHIPTCAVAGFAFDAQVWPHVRERTLATVALDFPKKL